MVKKKRLKLAAWTGILAAVIFWLWWGNRTIGISHYEISLDDHRELDGFTIVQVSDLHNTEFGRGSDDLLRLIQDSSPDIIAVTGDLISREDHVYETAMDFISKAQSIAPVYFVTGNHEAYHEHFSKIRRELLERGVRVLTNEETFVDYGSSRIRLIGTEDPAFAGRSGLSEERILGAALGDLRSAGEDFTLLLSHRPEFFSLYVLYELDLVLAGHAHGGQVRLPFIGALTAPGQGWFPDYTEGVHEAGDTRMVVSRGLGNSIIPLRVNNPPELVVVSLAAPIR